MNENMKNMEINEETLEQAAGGNGGWNVRGTVCNLTYGCLTIRDTPSNAGRILGGLENGDWVIVYDRVGDFYRIYTECAALGYPCCTPAFQGVGYVNANFVSMYGA